MSDTVARLLAELKAGLSGVYGSRLSGVYLFGSNARGDAQPESDCDVLVVLDRVDDYGAEIDRTSVLISRVSLSHGISVSRVFASACDWERGGSSFLANVRSEAIPA